MFYKKKFLLVNNIHNHCPKMYTACPSPKFIYIVVHLRAALL